MDSRYTVIAVVGHIDHGKTSLVKALTGVDTDTHPEEKRRGITIDLGFAVWRDQNDEYALIDAPGHQKYIGNLVSGVSHVDLGMLVVAADQGIQAQTLEHVAVLRAIGVTKIMVVISRIDLVPPSVIEPLSEELRMFLAEFDWLDFPIVQFSAVKSHGLSDVQACLRSHAIGTRQEDDLPFRMPIDRTLSIAGRGCVVAGSIWNGRIRVGESLSIAGRCDVRVRGIESHGRVVEESSRGRRVAVNLVGVSANELHRGDELIARESYCTSRRLLVQLKMFDSAPVVSCPATVQMHTATLGSEARIVGVSRLRRNDEAFCVLETRDPVIGTYGQRFLLRSPYPVGCFAGGSILTTLAPGMGTLRNQLRLAECLVDSDASQRLGGWIDFVGQLDPRRQCLSWQLGIPPDQLDRFIRQAVEAGECVAVHERLLISKRYAQETQDRLVRYLSNVAEQEANVWQPEQSLLRRGGTDCSPDVVRWCLDQLCQKRVVAKVNGMVAMATDENQLSKLQRTRLSQLLATLHGQRTPPSIAEIADLLSIPPDSLATLVRFAQQQNLVVEIGDGWVFAHEVLAELVRQMSELFEKHESLSVAQIRDEWEITRKHAIPLLEFFDRVGITIRQDGRRRAGSELSRWLSQSHETEISLP